MTVSSELQGGISQTCRPMRCCMLALILLRRLARGFRAADGAASGGIVAERPGLNLRARYHLSTPPTAPARRHRARLEQLLLPRHRLSPARRPILHPNLQPYRCNTHECSAGLENLISLGVADTSPGRLTHIRCNIVAIKRGCSRRRLGRVLAIDADKFRRAGLQPCA
jgi:hypothetical protein